MKNSVILKTAAVLCGINMFFALWTTWTMSAARSRIVIAEESIAKNKEIISSLRSAITSESSVRENNIERLNSTTNKLNQQLKEILRNLSVE